MANFSTKAEQLKRKYMKTRQLTTDTWNALIDLIETAYIVNVIQNSQLTPEEIRDMLQSLTGINRLDASAIQNLPDGGLSNTLTAYEIRDLLQTLVSTERLDATAIQNIHANMVSIDSVMFQGELLTNVDEALTALFEYINNANDSSNIWVHTSESLICHPNKKYLATNLSEKVEFTLPQLIQYSVEQEQYTIDIANRQGIGWKILIPEEWSVRFSGLEITTTLESTTEHDSISLLFTGNNTFTVISASGNIYYS